MHKTAERAEPATTMALGRETHQAVGDLGLAVAPSRAKLLIFNPKVHIQAQNNPLLGVYRCSTSGQ